MANSFPSSGGNRPGYYQRRNNDPFAHIRRNGRIKEPEIRVISPEGKQLGIMQTERALALAQQFNLDLVEMAATAKPPVCRIMDYGKYRYEQSKKEKESRKNQKVVTLKEVRLSPTIEEHDFQTKLKNVVKFLENGDKVKVSIRFRGRQITHSEIGRNILMKMVQQVSEVGAMEKAPNMEGRSMMIILAPKVPK